MGALRGDDAAPPKTEKQKRRRTAANAIKLQEAWSSDRVRRQNYRLRMQRAGLSFHNFGGDSLGGTSVDPDFDEGL